METTGFPGYAPPASSFHPMLTVRSGAIERQGTAPGDRNSMRPSNCKPTTHPAPQRLPVTSTTTTDPAMPLQVLPQTKTPHPPSQRNLAGSDVISQDKDLVGGGRLGHD